MFKGVKVRVREISDIQPIAESTNPSLHTAHCNEMIDFQSQQWTASRLDCQTLDSGLTLASRSEDLHFQ